MNSGGLLGKTACTIQCFATTALLAVSIGCAGQSKLTRLQDAASDYNVATRFGRMDVATLLVSPSEYEAFSSRHAAWGGAIRVSDVEYEGIRLVDEDKAIVLVTVGWQRLDESTLRVTQLAQEWTFGYGGWRLTKEVRNTGDAGLIGD